jgi:hypothetical protein
VRIRLGLTRLVLILSLPITPALADCVPDQVAELPVTMSTLQPVITAQINGTDVPFVVNSGALASTISPRTATELNLKLSPPPANLGFSRVEVDSASFGFMIGGANQFSVTSANTFTLGRQQIRDKAFLVFAPDEGQAGFLGQDILRAGDVEYDLANGAVRIWHSRECHGAGLAYWAKSDPSSVSSIGFDHALPFTIATVYVNGAPVRALFDTASRVSMLDSVAAARMGIRPSGADAMNGSSLEGKESAASWIARVDSFRIGGEEIRNTRLRIGHIAMAKVDMVLGTDFFLAHRIYVASGQSQLVFTHNGMPFFDANPQSARAATRDTSVNAGVLPTVEITASAIDGIWTAPGLRLTVWSDTRGHESCTFDELDLGVLHLPCSNVAHAASVFYFEVPSDHPILKSRCAGRIAANQFYGSCDLPQGTALWSMTRR